MNICKRFCHPWLSVVCEFSCLYFLLNFCHHHHHHHHLDIISTILTSSPLPRNNLTWVSSPPSVPSPFPFPGPRFGRRLRTFVASEQPAWLLGSGKQPRKPATTHGRLSQQAWFVPSLRSLRSLRVSICRRCSSPRWVENRWLTLLGRRESVMVPSSAGSWVLGVRDNCQVVVIANEQSALQSLHCLVSRVDLSERLRYLNRHRHRSRGMCDGLFSLCLFVYANASSRNSYRDATSAASRRILL